jgi:meso-butanediol dehydrogenase/(S,S)-butanediol dehydrogenase/diacetyl reductase
MGRVQGKAIIITGAGSGIGEGFAHIFGEEGAKVGVCDLNTEAAERVTQYINNNGGDALAITADVSKRDQVRAGFKKFVDWAGSLDVIFNNAGFNKPMHLMDVTEENWHAIMNVNGLGVLICTQEAGKYMIEQKSGKIINTASIAGRQGYPAFVPYCASKFAVNALTQATARGLAEYNITCNSFAPGVVDTPLWIDLDRDLMEMGMSERPGQATEEFSAGILRGRAATPADLQGMALFLASKDSDYMTGQTIMIDGGMVLV